MSESVPHPHYQSLHPDDMERFKMEFADLHPRYHRACQGVMSLAQTELPKSFSPCDKPLLLQCSAKAPAHLLSPEPISTFPLCSFYHNKFVSPGYWPFPFPLRTIIHQSFSLYLKSACPGRFCAYPSLNSFTS